MKLNELIMKEICDYFETSPERIAARNRENKEVYHRAFAVYIIRRYTTMTWKDISKFIAGDSNRYDHSSLLYLYQYLENRLTNKNMKEVEVMFDAVNIKQRINRKIARHIDYTNVKESIKAIKEVCYTIVDQKEIQMKLQDCEK